MSILQIRAFTPQSPPFSSASINRLENRSESGLEVDPDPKTARSFLSTAWNYITRCLPLPKRGAALSISMPPVRNAATGPNADAVQAPSNKYRAVSIETPEKACKERFDPMFRGRFQDAARQPCEIENSKSSEASRFYRTINLARIRMTKGNLLEVPEKYRVWMRSISELHLSLLKDRLYISSASSGLVLP